MKEIYFKDTINEGISDPPRGIYKSKICIKWFLSKKSLSSLQIDSYNFFWVKNWIKDYIYIWLTEKEYEDKYIFRYRDLPLIINFKLKKKFGEKCKNILDKLNFNCFDSQRVIFIWDSLKELLERGWYKNYEWIIKIYWEFWWILTTKRNIWKIWKADILDDDGNVIESLENT